MRIQHCKRLHVWENEPPVWGELEWSHNHPLVAEVYCYIKCSTVPLPGDMQTRQVFIRRHVPSSMWGISCIGKAGTVGINGAFLGPAGFVHCFFSYIHSSWFKILTTGFIRIPAGSFKISSPYIRNLLHKESTSHLWYGAFNMDLFFPSLSQGIG